VERITFLLDRLREARVVLEAGAGTDLLDALFPTPIPGGELVSDAGRATELLAYLDFVREADRRLLETSHRLQPPGPKGCISPSTRNGGSRGGALALLDLDAELSASRS